MHLWTVRFETIRPMAAFPQAQLISSERQTDTRYHHEGRFRSSEKHCLFKLSVRGRGIFRNARGEHPIAAGSGFLCEINDPATAYYYPDDASEPWEFVYLSFLGPTATAMTREFVQRQGPVFRLPLEQGFAAELIAWQKHAGHTLPLAPADGARVVANLFAALSASRMETMQASRGSELVRRTVEAIRHTISRNVNVSELARSQGVSREHLSRVFKQETSWTPHQFILRERIQEACRLLKETSLPNKEIAGHLGYDTVPHFNRTFKRLMHMSPLQFRRVGILPIR
jgi:AraC-like DNA-binding protein